MSRNYHRLPTPIEKSHMENLKYEVNTAMGIKQAILCIQLLHIHMGILYLKMTTKCKGSYGKVFLLCSMLLLYACSSPRTFRLNPASNVSGSQFMVGAAENSIALIPGYPMGGYGSGGKIARGLWMDLSCKATYIQDRTGNRLAIISCDLWSVPMGLTLEVSEILKKSPIQYRLGASQILLTATHTHNSQGGFATSEAYNSLASPVAGFDPSVFDFLATTIVHTIIEAIDSKKKAVAAISTSNIEGLIRNRSISAFNALASDAKNEISNKVKRAEEYFKDKRLPVFVTDPSEFTAVDPIVTTLTFRGSDNQSAQPIAILNFLSFHPTVMGHFTGVYSPDIFGVMDRILKKRLGFNNCVVSFINGSEGDISANWMVNDIKNTIDLGKEMTTRIIEGMASSKPLAIQDLYISYDIVNISNALVSIPLRGNVPMCFHALEAKTAESPYPGIATVGGAEDGRTALYYQGMQEGIVTDDCIPGHGNKASGLPGAVDKTFAPLPAILRGVIEASFKDVIENTAPDEVPLAVYRIGNIALATIPGEPTTAVGYYVKKAVANGLNIDQEHVLIVGLANEYLSYFTTPAEYGSQQYEGASTMYGVHAGSFLEQELGKLAATPSDVSTDRQVKLKPGPAKDLCQVNSFDDTWKIEESLTNFLVDLETGLPSNRYPVFQFTHQLSGPAKVAIQYPEVHIEKYNPQNKDWEIFIHDKDNYRLVKAIKGIDQQEVTWQILWISNPNVEQSYRFSAQLEDKVTYQSVTFTPGKMTTVQKISVQADDN